MNNRNVLLINHPNETWPLKGEQASKQDRNKHIPPCLLQHNREREVSGWLAVPSWSRFYNKGSLVSSFYQAKFEVIKYDQHPNQFILMNSFWAIAAKTSKLPDYNQRAIKRFFIFNSEASKRLYVELKLTAYTFIVGYFEIKRFS